MGCKHSIPMVAPDSPPFTTPESARTKRDGRSRSHEATALLENHGSVVAVVSSHMGMEYSFAKDYRIIRHVGGTLSQIYMVVKNQSNCPTKSTTAPIVQIGKNHSPSSVDASESERAYGEDLNFYVMQVIDMKSVAPERRESMKDEIKSLKRIDHANILRVCDVYDNIETNNTIQMVTELCTGQDLASYAATPVSERKARPIVIQILVAVNYMHKRGVFHHNLSLENIVFTDDSNEMIKITYAGLASRSASLNSVSHYLSGPRNRGDRDIYSIGSIAYQLLSGGREPPTSVDVHSDNDVVASSKRQNLFQSPIWGRILITTEAMSFIESAMQHGFLTVLQALQHKWITQEPVFYLQGAGASSLSDAKGQGHLVPTSLQSMETLTDPNRERNEAKENLAPSCGTTERATQSLLPLAYNENEQMESKIDLVQEVNSIIPRADSAESDNVDPGPGETPGPEEADDSRRNAAIVTPEVEPETVSLDAKVDIVEPTSEVETTPDEEAMGVIVPQPQPAELIVRETPGTEETEYIDQNYTHAPVAELASVSFDVQVDNVEQATEVETALDEEAIGAIVSPRQSADVTVEETPDTDVDSDQNSPLTAVVEVETVLVDSQADFVEKVIENDSSSDEESVNVISPPEQSAESMSEEASDSEETNDDDDSKSSSDDESVGVAMAHDPALTETVALDKPPLAPANPITSSTSAPMTPARVRKSFVSFEPGSPSSPSQTPAEFRDLRDIFRQASIAAEGPITMEELRERLRMLNKYTEEEVNSWFSGAHFDDSRNLNYKAILAEAIRSRRKIERLRAEEAFRAIDKGKQGFVTVGNLRAVLGAGNTEYIEKMIKEADTKHDGRITYEKFKEVLERSNRTEI